MKTNTAFIKLQLLFPNRTLSSLETAVLTRMLLDYLKYIHGVDGLCGNPPLVASQSVELYITYRPETKSYAFLFVHRRLKEELMDVCENTRQALIHMGYKVGALEAAGNDLAFEVEES